MTLNKKRLLFFALVAAINLFLFNYFHYRQVQTREMFIQNRLYSDWHQVVDNLAAEAASPFRVFLEHDASGNLRTFYQTDDWRPPMQNGEFFHDEVPEFSAVIGINHYIEGMEYLHVEGIDYQIIGIVGAAYPSRLDSLILLQGENPNLPMYRQVIDTNSWRELERILPDATVETSRNLFDEMILVNMVLISAIFFGLSSYVFHSFTEKNDRTLHLLGYSRASIFLANCGMIGGSYLIAFGGVLLLTSLIGNVQTMELIAPKLMMLAMALSSYGMLAIMGQRRSRV